MKFDVLIVGAGLAGAPPATLRGSTLKVGIVETRPLPAWRAGMRASTRSARPTWISSPPSASGSTSTRPAWRRCTTWRSTATPAAGSISRPTTAACAARLDPRIQPDAARASETVKRQHNVTLICPASPAGPRH